MHDVQTKWNAASEVLSRELGGTRRKPQETSVRISGNRARSDPSTEPNP